jgi:TonB family protein
MNRSIGFGIVVLVLISTLTSLAQSKYAEQGEVTYWFGIENDGSTFVLELRKPGEVEFIPVTGVISKGAWKQDATKVEMELNKRFLRLSGTIEGNHMQGIATSRKGSHWTWSAVKQPQVIVTSAPKYPPLARAARISGSVIVDVDVDAVGVVTSVRLVQGHPLLRDASKDAATRFRFQPAENKSVRTARLAFTFRHFDVDQERIISPLILSPYQIEIRGGVTVLHKEQSNLRREHE